MAGVTWTRTRTTQALPTGADVERMAITLADRMGREGVEHIRSEIWAIPRFKRPTGRSTKAWTYALKRSKGIQEVRFLNGAVSKQGVNYPRYVHLSGHPRSDLLMAEVNDWARNEFGPALGAAFGEGYIKLRAAGVVKVERD